MSVISKTTLCYVSIFLFFFLSYGYFFQGGGWNQNGRICLTRAIIDYGTFSIDNYREDSPAMKFVNTGDWALYNGHYYCNKSPGLSFLAVPSFACAQYVLKHVVYAQPEQQVLYSAYVSNLCTTVIMASLLCVLLFYTGHRLFDLSLGSSLLMALFYGFGTLAFPYSTAFYCHQPAAFCSFAALVLAMLIRHSASQKKHVLALMGGFSGGMGILIEPSCVYLSAAVVLYLMYFKETRRYIPLFIAGCIPPGIIQAFYNGVCFGNPLASSYQYSNDLVMWKENGKLFGIPRLQTIIQLLFSPYRGVFFSSPVLLMAVPGAILFFKSSTWRAEVVLCAGASLCLFILIASFYAWHGGWAPGPRYLLPAFPWFFLPAVLALKRFPKTFIIIGFVSIVINLSITVVGIEIPGEIKNPLADVVFKNIIAGSVSINPLPFSNFGDYPDIHTLAAVSQWQGIRNFNSFNLGEIFFPYNLKSIFPLLCLWLVWGVWWVKSTSTVNIKSEKD
jgi:hypothetical protein